jgi:hypothetical protein
MAQGRNANREGARSNELYQLQALNRIVTAVTTGTNSLATESTLLSVLQAIIASDQDIEILLVRDTGNADKVVQQITNYETGVPVVSYKDVDGNPYTPTGPLEYLPLEYLDPSAVMNLMLTELIAINANLTPSLRVPLLQRLGLPAAVDSGNIATGKRSVSFLNAGSLDITIATGTLKPGESITFNAGGQGDTLGSNFNNLNYEYRYNKTTS